MLNDLQQLGLNRNQANVYYGLLRLGKCTVQELASATGLNRVTVHGIVEQLEAMEICCTIRKGKTRYVLPLDPVALRFLLRNQAARIAQQEQLFGRIAPALQQLYRHPHGRSEVVVLDGDMTYDYLIEGVNAGRIGTPEQIVLNVDLLTQEGIALMRSRLYPRLRAQAVPLSLIVPDTPAGRAFVAQHFLKQPETSPPIVARFLPERDFRFATHIATYPEAVAYVSYHANSAILLMDSEVRNTMRQFFQFLWDRGGGEVTNRP